MTQPLLVFDPFIGSRIDPHVHACLPIAYRGNPNKAWLFDPWTGEKRTADAVANDYQGRAIWHSSWGPMPGMTLTPPGEHDLGTVQVVEPSGGGKLAGDHYYRVDVIAPISPEVEPYVAECADIIEALNMTFNEGEAFKALWRLAAARMGKGKPGGKGAQYDADKAAHYGARVAAQARLQGK